MELIHLAFMLPGVVIAVIAITELLTSLTKS